MGPLGVFDVWASVANLAIGAPDGDLLGVLALTLPYVRYAAGDVPWP